MTQVAHGDDITAADGWEHGGDEVNSAEMFELLRVEVEPAAVVHPLAEQLDRRLCAVLFLLWHVQVVNENYNLILALLRPEVPLASSSAHFGINQTLNLISIGLPWKGSRQKSILLVVIVLVEFIRHVDWLACACGAAKQDMHVIFYIEVQEVIVPDGVIGRDDQLIVRDALGDDKGWHCLWPILPH